MGLHFGKTKGAAGEYSAPIGASVRNMLNLFFKCGSCGGRLITDEATAGSSVKCHHCKASTAVPTNIMVYECAGCKQPLKAAAEMNRELLDCPTCGTKVRCPYWQDDQIIFDCRRCHESVSVTQGNAGTLTRCPKCQGWIRAPQLLREVGDAIAETVRQARHAKSWPTEEEPRSAA
jgi:DNA-directed RNA polymerase subunit RPC12/RpoP